MTDEQRASSVALAVVDEIACTDSLEPAVDRAARLVEPALAAVRMAERRAIVAWLRAAPRCFGQLADAIENGDHLTPEERS